MRLTKTVVVVVAVIALLVASGLYASLHSFDQPTVNCSADQGSDGRIQVVAAENFWGSLVSQLGGTRVNVLSIVSDPNADPHEYESNAASAQAVANACLVIVNGAGYDSWALRLIAASSNSHQTVLNVQQLLGEQVGANPHFWYSPRYVNETIRGIFNDLAEVDPGSVSYYTQQYTDLNLSLAPCNAKIQQIAETHGGTKVAATEDLFAYLANATKLDLVSPPEFMEAVAEGNDPSAASLEEFQQQLQNRSAAVLVYNQQTVTQLTSEMKSLAVQNDIPVVGVTETIQPPNLSFQDWMYGQLDQLQNALDIKAQGS